MSAASSSPSWLSSLSSSGLSSSSIDSSNSSNASHAETKQGVCTATLSDTDGLTSVSLPPIWILCPGERVNIKTENTQIIYGHGRLDLNPACGDATSYSAQTNYISSNRFIEKTSETLPDPARWEFERPRLPDGTLLSEKILRFGTPHEQRREFSQTLQWTDALQSLGFSDSDTGRLLSTQLGSLLPTLIPDGKLGPMLEHISRSLANEGITIPSTELATRLDSLRHSLRRGYDLPQAHDGQSLEEWAYGPLRGSTKLAYSTSAAIDRASTAHYLTNRYMREYHMNRETAINAATEIIDTGAPSSELKAHEWKPIAHEPPASALQATLANTASFGTTRSEQIKNLKLQNTYTDRPTAHKRRKDAIEARMNARSAKAKRMQQTIQEALATRV